jgi:hypothetical protein
LIEVDSQGFSVLIFAVRIHFEVIFNSHGGIIGGKRPIVKEPANPTNPAHEKVEELENCLVIVWDQAKK